MSKIEFRISQEATIYYTTFVEASSFEEAYAMARSGELSDWETDLDSASINGAYFILNTATDEEKSFD